MADNRIEVCEKIANDAEQDVKDFDGKPLTGKVVAQYFACQGAQITALANILKSILEEQKKDE